jgi:hypothetical protein
MKRNHSFSFLTLLTVGFLLINACKHEVVEATKDPVAEALLNLGKANVFTDLINKNGVGLIDTNKSQTLFLPTDEAFEHLDIASKLDYDKATLIAFFGSQMLDKTWFSANFKSGQMVMLNLDTTRMYKGADFTQIEDALVEKADLQVGKLVVHLVDRLFSPEILIGHDHNGHAGHDHGSGMTDNCGTAGAPQKSIDEAAAFREKLSTALLKFPTWLPSQTAPRSLIDGFSLMGGRNNGLPYIHYFSTKNMEDGKFMDPNAPEGLMYGTTADGEVFPISAVFLTREATSAQLHTLNCIYMFHEHDNLPGVMMHAFHKAYPSPTRGFDHEADPVLVRKMKVK